MAVIHSVAIVNWRLAYNSADAFICTDENQSPIHVLLYEQNQHRSCPHNFDYHSASMLAPATLLYSQLSSQNYTRRQARAGCVKDVKKKEQPLLIPQHTQSKGLHHHPLRVKAIKGKPHVHPMNVHRGRRGIAPLKQHSQNSRWFYLVHDLF
jgi:hypothetical protein